MPIFITPTSIQEVTITEKCNNPNPPKRKLKDESEGYHVNIPLVKKRIWLLFLMNNATKNLYFLTISFPLYLDDDVAYRCFNSWLTNMRTHAGLKNYLWVAERQGNGTVHFHIFIGEFLWIGRANKAMKSALTTAYKNGDLTPEQFKSCKDYRGVHLSKDKKGKVQNLRRIKAKNQRKAIVNYIAKYVTKADEKNEQVHKHLAWFCSRSFSRLKVSYMITDEASALQLLTDGNIDLNYCFTDIPSRKIYPYVSIPRNNIEFDFYVWMNEQLFLNIPLYHTVELCQ
jgi:hypothetical protein